MRYEVVIFGVKDMTAEIVEYIMQNNIAKVDLVVTIHPDVTKKNQVSGYQGLSWLTDKYGIEVYETRSYSLNDEDSKRFFSENEFGLGISMSWQRLIPGEVLERFEHGVFGLHGGCGYLPFGRGRSPLNWAVVRGDTRFILNMFQYDEKADSPNVFANEMFAINPHDTIRTLQYKNVLVSRRLITKLLEAHKEGTIRVRRDSKDFDSWNGKRTAADGLMDFHARTRELYNLVRAVTKPFPGAFCYAGSEKVIVWSAHPFDEMLDFSMYAPGEIIAVMDGKLIVRTLDGSLLIEEFECESVLAPGMILSGECTDTDSRQTADGEA